VFKRCHSSADEERSIGSKEASLKKGLALVTVGAVLAVPAAAQAQEWLTFREAGAAIRWWGRVNAKENGDTITRHRVDLCERSTARRVVCWYEKGGYDIDGYDFQCWGEVRVIEYATYYSIARIRHGRFRYKCY
jgi:hypothetical protein